MAPVVSRRLLARTVAAKLIAEPQHSRRWLRALAAYLLAHDMTKDAALVVSDVVRELYAQDHRLLARVTSARPLSAGVRAELKTRLRQLTGARTVDLHETVDRSLIGGLVARTPDAELDLTIRRQLRQLANLAPSHSMTKETS